MKTTSQVDKKLVVKIKLSSGERTFLMTKGELKLFKLVSGLGLETKGVYR